MFETYHQRSRLQPQRTNETNWQTNGRKTIRSVGGGYWLQPQNWYNYQSGTRRRHKLNGFRTGVNGTITQEDALTGTKATQKICRPSVISEKGGIFDKEEYEVTSQFNKKKYLPLARDIPVAVSHYCCNVMKKKPVKKAQKAMNAYPYVATMAEESRIRMQGWIRTGCNAFDSKSPKSMPMSYWTEQDVLRYAVENNIKFASVYGDIVAVDEDGNQYNPHSLLIQNCKLKCTGCERTGCIFCAFGFHSEKGETRFQRLARTHPRQYEYCMGGGQWVDNPAYDPTAPKMDGAWQNWNPKKIWVPSKQGLGMKKVFDMVNEIYGKDFYRYE